MEVLRKNALEAVASVWLVLVAVQFISNYFLFGPGAEGPDLTWVYVLILVVTVGTGIYKALLPDESTCP